MSKSYIDIVGDGGSDVLGQVAALEEAIATATAGIGAMVAVGSGKGGVGKSTITAALATMLARRGSRVAVFDCDFNGPCQAQLIGVENQPWIPGLNGLMMPRNADGIGVVSLGSVLGTAEAAGFESVAQGEEFTWRATREFALLRQLLSSVEWGELDLLLYDLPPGAERTCYYADVLAARTSFLIVTTPGELSRAVVARSLTALDGTKGKLIGYVENMSGYYCSGCETVRPLFPEATTELSLECLAEVPFDPRLDLRTIETSPTGQALECLADTLELLPETTSK